MTSSLLIKHGWISDRPFIFSSLASHFSLIAVRSGSNLNILWDRHSDTSPLTKNHKNLFGWKAHKTHLGKDKLLFLPPFEALKYRFFKTWCPFHSFTYYYNLLLLEKVSSLTQCHVCVWSCFPLMFTMFMKLVP